MTNPKLRTRISEIQTRMNKRKEMMERIHSQWFGNALFPDWNHPMGRVIFAYLEDVDRLRNEYQAINCFTSISLF